jgi:membrane-associated phospholipid phosphatase
MGSWLSRNKHALVLLYVIVFYTWFHYLERTAVPVISVKSPLDALIPFNELFVIPYYIWYAYVPVMVVYFLFTSKTDFLKLCGFLFVGMTICLLIYTFFPNGQPLRPYAFERQNIFVDIVRKLYRVDTPTNVCPSIHCLNAIAIHIAIAKSELGRKRWRRAVSVTVMILVCMSTVALKQHSIIDVIAAVILSLNLYLFFYCVPRRRALRRRAVAKL